MAAELVTIYWRDIPAQITAQEGRTREKALLGARFQHAIDRAAMVAGMDDTDSYVAQWRRESTPLSDDMAAAVADEVARIDAAYDPERLEHLVQSGGIETRPPSTRTTHPLAESRHPDDRYHPQLHQPRSGHRLWPTVRDDR